MESAQAIFKKVQQISSQLSSWLQPSHRQHGHCGKENAVFTASVSGSAPSLTIGSSRSLRSLWTSVSCASGRPLAKRYAQGKIMRTANIVIMFSFAAISALLGVFSLIAGTGNYPNSLAATASLTGLLIISLAYGLLALGCKEKSGKLHFLTLALYIISAILGVIASSNIGLVPYIMHSMNLSLIPALSYVVPVLPICATVSIAAYIAARICIHRNKTGAIPAPGTSA